MRTRILLLIGILATAAAPAVFATTLVRLSLQQLSQASTAIVRGHVLSQQSLWNAAHTRIVTLTTVALAETLKGSPPPTLVIEQLGGTVGNFRVHVSGTVHFLPDSDYLLFLEPAGTDTSKFLVVGMMQGAYRVYRDAMTSQERVIRPLAGLSTGPSEGAMKVSEQTLPLGTFRQQIAGALENPIVVPHGTSIPLTIESAESRGAGRLRVLARTATSLFPTASLVIPAGSPIEGTAEKLSGVWKIQWTELSLRGRRVAISATSQEPAGRSLSGRTLVVSVR